MKLAFALGNNGKEYDGTRHNIGFYVADAFAKKYGVSFNAKTKFKAELAECSLNGEKILIAKPHTFYNLVGESYRLLTDFYKIDSADTIVIHDELALPFGTLRIREGGSDAGNNGIKSINQHGGDTTVRLRIGIGNEQRTIMGDTDFVLGRFTEDESETLEPLIAKKACDILDDFIQNSHVITSHRLL